MVFTPLPFDFDIYQIMARLLILFTALPVHEYAHALVASQLGDNTPIREGRLTLSPFAHLNLFGSIALLLFGFGWANPVRIDCGNFKNPKLGIAISSLAGPAANIIMSTATLALIKIIVGVVMMSGAQANEMLYYFVQVLDFMVDINLWLAVLNLLPIPPLDGSKILGVILPAKYYFRMSRYEGAITVVLLVLLYTGVLFTPMAWISGKLYAVIDFITMPVDLIFRGL